MLATALLLASLPAAAQTISEQYLLAAANQDRAQRNLPPIRLDAHLNQAALLHARQMADRRGISHRFTGEADLAERAAAAGAHFSLVTENVAEAPNAALIHEMWMKSEGHRANLLDARVDSVGMAVIARGGQLYAVEDFARTVASLSIQKQEAAVASLLERTGIGLTSDEAVQHDARATCRLATGYAGARKPWFVMRYTAADLSELPSELTSRLSSGKYSEAAVGACSATEASSFSSYNIAVLLYR